MTTYLCDTTVIIDNLRGNNRATIFLNKQPKVTISIVSAGELYQGARSKIELKKIKKLIGYFTIFPINETISTRALELLLTYTLSNHLLILDALIAATAIHHNLTLITSNHKHFSMIPELTLEKW